MAHTRDDTIRDMTKNYLDTIDPANPPSPATINEGIIDTVATAIRMENAMREKGEKWRIPDRLIPNQIADIILRLYPVANIACMGTNGSSDYDLLAIYQTTGKNQGIYVSDEQYFKHIILQYCYSVTQREIEETMALLKTRAPRMTRCVDKDLIAVNNGIFNYDTKTLMPFDPNLVFIAKSKVDYNPTANNVIIHNKNDGTDWDVESWIEDIADDKEVAQLIWELLGAIIRSNVSWNKSAWFYSNTGNNGKGTLCELMRQLCGDGTYASIPLSDFGKDFALEPLTRATAIIVDENDVGTFIDKAANIKALITGDVIQINRKFKVPIAYKFKGFMVQCLNEMPRIKDKSDSFYRRQLFVPFTKCFTGKERKYIKDDYLKRKEVLEYVLFKVLNTNYYELSEPEVCKNALIIYKEFNDPVRQFVEEILPLCVWDLLPFNFLYDLYKAWFKKTSPNGTLQGRNTFVNDLINVIQTNDEWISKGARAKIWTGNKMDDPEPLIAEYDLKDWMEPKYVTSKDINAKCHPILQDNYRGLLRNKNKQVIVMNNTQDDQTYNYN